MHFSVRFSKWLTEFGSRCNNLIYMFVKTRLMEKETFFPLHGGIAYCFRTKSGEDTGCKMSNSTCMVSLLQYMTAFRWGFSTELFLHSFLIHAVYRALYHISGAKQRGIDTFLCSSLTNIFVVETSGVRLSGRFLVVVASSLRSRLMCTLSHNTRRQGIR